MAKSDGKKSLMGIIGGILGGNKGNNDEELKKALEAVKRDPNSLRKRHKLADTYAKAEITGKAIETYMGLAQEYIAREFFPQAIAVYRQVLKINPNLYDAQLKLADVLNDTGRRSDALAELQKLALRYESTGALRISGEIIQRMLDMDPDNVPLRVKLAELYLRLSERVPCIAEFERALRKIGEQEHWSDYIKVGERLLYIEPEHLHTLKMVSRLYLDANDPMKAIVKLQQAFKIDRRDPDTLELLAIAFEKLQQPSKTISVLEELVDVYLEQDQTTHAQEVLNQLIELAPDNQSYRDQLKGLGLAPKPTSTPSPATPETKAPTKTVATTSSATASTASTASSATPSAVAAKKAPLFSAPTTEFSEPEIKKLLSDAEVYLKYNMPARVEEVVNQVLDSIPNHPGAIALRLELHLLQEQFELAAQDCLLLAELAEDTQTAQTYLDRVLDMEHISNELQEQAYQLSIELKQRKVQSSSSSVLAQAQVPLRAVPQTAAPSTSEEEDDFGAESTPTSPPTWSASSPAPAPVPVDTAPKRPTLANITPPPGILAASAQASTTPRPNSITIPLPDEASHLANAHIPSEASEFADALDIPSNLDDIQDVDDIVVSEEDDILIVDDVEVVDDAHDIDIVVVDDLEPSSTPVLPPTHTPFPLATEQNNIPHTPVAFSAPQVSAPPPQMQRLFSPPSFSAPVPAAAPAVPAAPAALPSVLPPPPSFARSASDSVETDDPFAKVLQQRKTKQEDTYDEEDERMYSFLQQPIVVQKTAEQPANANVSDMEAAAARLEALIRAKEESSTPVEESSNLSSEPVVSSASELPPPPFAALKSTELPPPPFAPAKPVALPPPPFASAKPFTPRTSSPFEQQPRTDKLKTTPPESLPPAPSFTPVQEEATVQRPAFNLTETTTPDLEPSAALEEVTVERPAFQIPVPEEQEIAVVEDIPTAEAEADDIIYVSDDAIDDAIEIQDEINITDSLVLDAVQEDAPFAEEFEQAFRYIEQEEYQYALDIYQQILSRDPHNDVARRGEQEILALLATPAQPTQDENFLLDLDLDSALGAISEKERDRAAQEIQQFADAVKQEIGTEDCEPHFDLGIAYQGMGLYSQAVDAFKLCITHHYRTHDSYKMLGNCYLSQNLLPDALEAFKQALNIPGITTEERLDTMFEIGHAYEQNAQYPMAIQYYDEVALLDDSHRNVRARIQRIQSIMARS